MSGKFITFEGGEGSGKSLQLSRFAEYLKTKGHAVVTTREPGGTETGKEIRRLLVEGDKDKFDELHENKLVLSHRFNDSTIAYQYYGSGKFADTKIMDTLYNLVAGTFKPDMTFLLDVDVRQGLERSFKKAETMANKELRFENVDIAFHERLRRGYLELAQKEPERFIVINAGGTIEEVTAEIIRKYEERLSA